MTTSATPSPSVVNSRIEGMRDMDPAERRDAIASASGIDEASAAALSGRQ